MNFKAIFVHFLFYCGLLIHVAASMIMVDLISTHLESSAAIKFFLMTTVVTLSFLNGLYMVEGFKKKKEATNNFQNPIPKTQ